MNLKRKVFTWVDLKESVTVNINLRTYTASLEKYHKLEMKVKAIFGSVVINVMLPTSFVMRTHRSLFLFFQDYFACVI